MELLDPVEVRTLGALIEKEATTPEYYPLSLNALVNATNQKSNRNPVVDYSEEDVREALERLRAKKLAMVIVGNGRVTKYGQTISEQLNLGRRELAALCVLMLRGPQTLGEVKDRAERIFAFGDLEETERTLDRLAEWPAGALVMRLPRQPGQKEARYAHLLSGQPADEVATEGDAPAPAAQPQTARIAQLEADLQQMRTEFDDLKRRFEELEALLR